MTDHVLTGLDGANPLGFMAALGALAATTTADPTVRLGWVDQGRWRPVLSTTLDRDALVAALAADLRTWDDDPAVQALVYEKPGKPGKMAHDLKPPPAIWTSYLQGLRARAVTSALPGFLEGPRRSLDYAAAFATEAAVDNNGNTKPTALHFTAGQQEILKAVLELVANVTTDDLVEALFGPWTYARELPVLSWDSSVSRDYALRADDPSKSKKTGVPGADWLGFRGLAFFPVFPVGDEIRTTGCAGGWKTGTFTWPLWTGRLGVHAARSLMTLGELDSATAHERRRRGIALVLRAGIRRSDQGGYGSFQPPAVLPPPAR